MSPKFLRDGELKSYSTKDLAKSYNRPIFAALN